jgi:hypothetical protein
MVNLMKILAKLITMILCAIFLISCTSPRFTTGVAINSAMPDRWQKENDQYVIDVGLTETKDFENVENAFYDLSANTGFIINDNRWHPKISGILTLGYHITENFKFRLGGGPTFIYDGGHIEGLEQAAVYGNIVSGFQYKNIRLEWDHYSSPFHDDSGTNFLKIIIDW